MELQITNKIQFNQLDVPASYIAEDGSLVSFSIVYSDGETGYFDFDLDVFKYDDGQDVHPSLCWTYGG